MSSDQRSSVARRTAGSRGFQGIHGVRGISVSSRKVVEESFNYACSYIPEALQQDADADIRYGMAFVGMA
jgi:hypothetical protein